MRLKLLPLIVWTIFRAAKGNAGYKMNVYKDLPGVYFEDLGHATLSNTAWTIVVYVPMQKIDIETSNLEQYVHYPLSYHVPVRERYGSTLLPATREQHDQNCTQSH